MILFLLFFQTIHVAQADEVTCYAEPTVRVEARMLCQSPAEYFCRADLNPSVMRVYNAIERLSDFRNSALSEMRFNQEKAPKEGCSALPPAEFEVCDKRLNEILARKLKTSERWSKVQKIFDEAKAGALRFLEARKEKEVRKGRSAASGFVTDMMATIGKAELEFGSPHCEHVDQLNPTNFSDSRMRGYALRSKRFVETHLNRVCVDATVLMSDELEQTLSRIFLHELGHSIDPSHYAADGSLTGYPFRLEAICLARDDSAAARLADSKCFVEKATVAGQSHRYTEQAEDVVRRPFGSAHVEIPGGEQCQQGQWGEAFSDWFSNEVWVQENEKNLRRAMAIVSEADELTLTTGVRLALSPELMESVSFFCPYYLQRRTYGDLATRRAQNKDSHPDEEDRLNGIMLAHPLVKYALGCAATSVHNAQSPLQAIDPRDRTGVRAYCGDHLYLKHQGVE